MEDAQEQNADGRRSKRRTKSRYCSTTVPSAVHYVGYVEDDETPEMIMSKFQELENIQSKSSAVVLEEEEEGQEKRLDKERQEPAQLTDEQLLEVFKQTSMFNVKTALQDNAMLAGIDEIMGIGQAGYDDMVSDDEDMLRSFWSDDDDDDWGGTSNKKRRRFQQLPSVFGRRPWLKRAIEW